MADDLFRLAALSPLDGRYRKDTSTLAGFFSEAALFRYRARVEIEYLIFLARSPGVSFVEALTPAQQAALRTLYRQFSDEDGIAVAAWDRRVNHDVKAVEYWLREHMDTLGLSNWNEALHFGLTSEDVNNLAYGLLIQEARDLVIVPALQQIESRLQQMAQAEAATAMLARTHGQPATPTTFGKEMNIFRVRLQRAIRDITNIRMTGKLNGASGSFAAHIAALPNFDWMKFSKAFIRTLNLEPLLLTTQIEPHDTLVALCDALRRANGILIDLSQDCWRYISDGYLIQAATSGEVGSSTMPHKVNPIDFENAEGNLGMAGALFEFFSRKLPISRLQRDLSDSTVLRNLGPAFGYSLVAYQRLLRGLNKVAVQPETLLADLRRHPEVLAEAIQTILRREGYPEPYEVLKGLTRGQALSLEDLHAFIDTLDISATARQELRALTPETYVGLARKLAVLRDEQEFSGW
jgi:adenylosuccinate lyase